MVKLIQYDYIMRSEVFSTNAFIQICNFSMNAALFRCFACRPAAFLSVWGGQPILEVGVVGADEDGGVFLVKKEKS